MTDERCALRLTRRYDATIEEVWEALVAGRWLGLGDVQLRVVEPGRAVELDLPGSVARIVLARDGAQTVLVLDHDDVEAPLGMRGMRVWTLALERLERAL